MVFDLRDNGGGLVRSLEKVLDPLMPEGDIAVATYRDGTTRTLVTSDAGECDLPMAVLVNGNTASAAELFALRRMRKWKPARKRWIMTIPTAKPIRSLQQQFRRFPNSKQSE